MKITYTLVGDYYLPNLAAPESPKVGCWGMLRFKEIDTTSGLSNYQFAFTPCKSTHFKRSASAGRFAFQGDVQNGNHAPHAPAYRQRPHGGTGHQRYH